MLNEILWDLRTILWLISAALLAFGTYIVWPSRWNIPAHMALAFFVIAQAIPVAFLSALDGQSASVVVELLKIHLGGALFFVIGVLLGASAVSRERVLRRWSALVRIGESTRVTGRTAFALGAALVALSLAIVMMGFVPMFAEDPLAAKFFRGTYSESYQPVAPLYRAGTTLITLLIPAVAAYAVAARRISWFVALVISLTLMIVTLQRGPAFSGILLFLGVMMIARRRIGAYLVLLLGSYVLGTLFYFVLGVLGVESFEGTQLSGGSLLSTIAATAPDLQDELWFFGRWTQANEPLTLGRTFIGGLVPGNFQWNPSVWTLTLGDPSIDVSTLNSGGLRLPLPMWGKVSFGDLGVAIVPLVSGLFAGYIARVSKHLMDAATENISRVWILILNGASASLLVTFYIMSYLDVVQFIIVAWVTAECLRRARTESSASRVGSAGLLG